MAKMYCHRCNQKQPTISKKRSGGWEEFWCKVCKSFLGSYRTG